MWLQMVPTISRNDGLAARTLEAARKLARNQAGKEPVTITVTDGIYYFDKPLVLTSEDSGSASAQVIYRAEHEGKAILSGACR